jgi:hypothetical protein
MSVRHILASAIVAAVLVAGPASAGYTTASDFSWTDNGQTVHLYDERGHYVVDTQSILSDEYHITALPTTFFVNPNGDIVKTEVGGLAYGDLTSDVASVMGQ